MENKQPQDEDGSGFHATDINEPQDLHRYLQEHFQQVAKNDFLTQYMITDLAMTA